MSQSEISMRNIIYVTHKRDETEITGSRTHMELEQRRIFVFLISSDWDNV